MPLSFFDQFIAAAMLLLTGYLTYSSIKNNPQNFTGATLNKSTKTMGFLALILIGFIGLLSIMLPAGELVSRSTAVKTDQSTTKATQHDRSV